MSKQTTTGSGLPQRKPMSALGHKRTFRSAITMSALPPKADIFSALAHVRFVPQADILVREAIEAFKFR